MTRLNNEYRDQKNGMIDYGHYRRVAAGLRKEARINVITDAGRALAICFGWLRRQVAQPKTSLRRA